MRSAVVVVGLVALLVANAGMAFAADVYEVKVKASGLN
jgi:hypothetical protein